MTELCSLQGPQRLMGTNQRLRAHLMLCGEFNMEWLTDCKRYDVWLTSIQLAWHLLHLELPEGSVDMYQSIHTLCNPAPDKSTS